VNFTFTFTFASLLSEPKNSAQQTAKYTNGATYIHVPLTRGSEPFVARSPLRGWQKLRTASQKGVYMGKMKFIGTEFVLQGKTVVLKYSLQNIKKLKMRNMIM